MTSVHRVLLLCALALCWSPTAPAGAAGVTARAVEYPGAEGEMPANLYLPEGAGPRPGVLVLHTVAGPGPNVEAFARALAVEGYVTLTPDLFSLHDFGAEGRTDHPLVRRDLEGALAFLAARPEVDPSRLGVVGFSFGGRLAVWLAAQRPAGIRAVVVYYAIADHRALGRPLAGRAARAEPLAAYAARVRAPVLIHHGEADTRVPVAQARLLHEALTRAGRAGQLHTYPGAGHLFDFALGPDARHHPEAARLSRARTLRFLHQHLGPAR